MVKPNSTVFRLPLKIKVSASPTDNLDGTVRPSKLSPRCFTVVDNELTLIYGGWYLQATCDCGERWMWVNCRVHAYRMQQVYNAVKYLHNARCWSVPVLWFTILHVLWNFSKVNGFNIQFQTNKASFWVFKTFSSSTKLKYNFKVFTSTYSL